MLFVVFVTGFGFVGITPTGAQVLLLTLCSGVIPDNAQGTLYGYLQPNPWTSSLAHPLKEPVNVHKGRHKYIYTHNFCKWSKTYPALYLLALESENSLLLGMKKQ